jgi:hypothetical protein
VATGRPHFVREGWCVDLYSSFSFTFFLPLARTQTAPLRVSYKKIALFALRPIICRPQQALRNQCLVFASHNLLRLFVRLTFWKTDLKMTASRFMRLPVIKFRSAQPQLAVVQSSKPSTTAALLFRPRAATKSYQSAMAPRFWTNTDPFQSSQLLAHSQPLQLNLILSHRLLPAQPPSHHFQPTHPLTLHRSPSCLISSTYWT